MALPAVVLAAGWTESAAPGLQAAAARGEVTSLAVVATPRGAALRLGYRGGMPPTFVPADGSACRASHAGDIRQFSLPLHRGAATVLAVDRLARVPQRLEIVSETGGRGDLWRMRFDDALSTHLYSDGHSGGFVVSPGEIQPTGDTTQAT